MVDRKQLDEIIQKNATNDWWKPKLFEQNTRHLIPAELTILTGPPPENRNYNCFIYAFGLQEESAVIKETKGFIYDILIKKLIEAGELVKTEEPKDGDYVVYQDPENYPDHLTHIGVLNGDKVVSKWAWGPLVEHSLWDVPESYGNEIFYLKALTKEQALNIYNQYKN